VSSISTPLQFVILNNSHSIKPLASAAAPLAAASVALSSVQLLLGHQTLSQARQLRRTAATLKAVVSHTDSSVGLAFDTHPRCTLTDDIEWAASCLTSAGASCYILLVSSTREDHGTVFVTRY